MLGYFSANGILNSPLPCIGNFKEFESYLSSSQIPTSVIFLESDSTSAAIEKFCQDNNTDKLTVIARHNKFFDKLFHKSVSKELAFGLKMPLLTLEDSF